MRPNLEVGIQIAQDTNLSLDIYDGHDPRHIPTYTMPDVAHMAGVPVSTLRTWVKGREYPTRNGLSSFKPLIEKPNPDSPLLSFTNVIETHVMAGIRRMYGVEMRKIRPALEYVETTLHKPHPLANQVFETDGVDLFVREVGQIINASCGGQVVIKDIIEAYLTRIEYDKEKYGYQFFPIIHRFGEIKADQIKQEPRIIMVNPRVSFGRPIIKRRGTPTESIADFFKTGETISEIASEFDLAEEEVEAALRYEQLAA